jgi:hypothetical protein
LRRERREAGLSPYPLATTANSKSRFASTEEESEARTETVTGLILLMRQMLPVLLKRWGKIPDPRNPKKLKHRLTVLLLYGILVFVFQYGSRRAANAEITRPMFEHNLRLLFPQLARLPHSDTLFRRLCRIDVGHIEQACLSTWSIS